LILGNNHFIPSFSGPKSGVTVNALSLKFHYLNHHGSWPVLPSEAAGLQAFLGPLGERDLNTEVRIALQNEPHPDVSLLKLFRIAALYADETLIH
jgi:hypothetical protein